MQTFMSEIISKKVYPKQQSVARSAFQVVMDKAVLLL
jgi:hypothetical protein